MNINFKHPVCKDYSPQLNNFFNIFYKYVKNNDWAIDIGAGTGDTTLVLAELVGEDGKVLSFEPSISYDLLLNNIEINQNLKNRIITYQLGAYNRDCIKKIVTNSLMDNGGIVDDLFFLENRRKDMPNSYDINVVDINNFIFQRFSHQERLKIKFIKIDTEGLDFLILNNLREFIMEYKPIFFIEWWGNEILSDILFDITKQIGYVSLRSDNFEKATAEDFRRKSDDIILIPK